MRTGIIKTVKTNRYTQIHNDVVQQKLKRADSIGILTYLLSLPETWVIQKTDLMNRFGRATVTNSFKELEDNGFLVSMKFRNGQRNIWGYAISDIEFTQEQIIEMIVETEYPCLEVKSRFEIDLSLYNSQVSKINNSENGGISTFSQVSIFNNSDSTVEPQQLNLNSSESTATKEKTNKKNTSKKTISKKTTSSSLSLEEIEQERKEVDIRLQESYAALPFEEIKKQLLNDTTVTIQTIKQYHALLEYRLKNYKEKPITTGNTRTEQVPDWFDTRNEGSDKQNEEIDFEKERERILEKIK